jgi:hypothetical protein
MYFGPDVVVLITEMGVFKPESVGNIKFIVIHSVNSLKPKLVRIMFNNSVRTTKETAFISYKAQQVTAF